MSIITAFSRPLKLSALEWTLYPTAPVNATWLRAHFAHDRFFLTALGSINMGVSTDGISWAHQTPPSQSVSGIVYAFGQWYLVQAQTAEYHIFTSTNAVNWLSLSLNIIRPYQLHNIIYANGLLVVVGNNGEVLTSSDGAANSWSNRHQLTGMSLRSIAYGNGMFVAVAEAGAQRLLTSPDGITWTPRSMPVTATFRRVVFGNGVFVAFADNTICTSTDGTAFIRRSPPPLTPTTTQWHGAFGAGYFVAVPAAAGFNAIRSINGISWTEDTTPSAAWQQVAFGNDRFVAATTNQVMVMPIT